MNENPTETRDLEVETPSKSTLKESDNLPPESSRGKSAKSAPPALLKIPAWVIAMLIISALGYTILHNFRNGQEAGSKEETEIAEGLISALRSTKSGFRTSGMFYQDTRTQSKQIPVEVKTPPAKITKSIPPIAKWKRPYDPRDEAYKAWGKITSTKTMSPGLWRRYAITLYLFDFPGGKEAFQHLADPPRSETAEEAALPISMRHRIAEERKSFFKPEEELKIWEQIYESPTLDLTKADELSRKVKFLRLGWYENIALAQLYHKAGQFTKAEARAQEAKLSCSLLYGVEALDIFMLVFGTIALLIFGLCAFLIRVTKLNLSASSKPAAAPQRAIQIAPTYAYDGIPAATFPPPLAYAPIPSFTSQAEKSDIKDALFSYKTLIVGFLVYYVSFMLIAYPIRLFSPLWSGLGASALNRLSLVMGITLYIPVVGITLWTLRFLTEQETGRTIRMREIWRALGFRFDQVGRDFGRACIGYLLLFPITVYAGLISHQIFEVWLKKYHFFTPINPVEIQSMILNSSLDQALIFIQAAVAAPIVEEMMFRGILFRGMRMKWGMLTAAALSSAIFALSHNTLPNGFLTLWSIGMGLSLVSAQKDRNSILPNIFMHAIHNGLISVMLTLVFSK